jgi:hypothetical protein
MTTYICDIETNALKNPTRVWCIGLKNTETGESKIFNHPDEDPEPFLAELTNATKLVGHNFIAYDYPVLCDLIPNFSFSTQDIIDTVIVSRLLNFNLEGGHSLEAWGERLGTPKGDFNDFSRWSKEMVDYLLTDLEVTYGVYNTLGKYLGSPQWEEAIRLELDMAWICLDIKRNGFPFDYDTALKLHKDISIQIEELDVSIQTSFPPMLSPIREINPVLTKHGTLHRKDFRWVEDGDLSPFSADAPFTLCEWVPFNAGSPKQIVTKLNQAGWRPYEKTKGYIKAEREKDEERLPHYAVYGWKVSEANLATLPDTAPEGARKLAQRILLASRRSVLNEWITAAGDSLEAQETPIRIHPTLNTLGAWTQRMSHVEPNVANIPRASTLYGSEFRKLFISGPDHYLVGVDADSIQLRILAHYMNDEAFTQALIAGKKEDGTDAHTRNMLALGPVCRSREVAKTYIYAFLLGAGIAKQAEILDCSRMEALDANESFLASLPGLALLKREAIPRDAANGYFKGLDNRLIICQGEHLMLAGYLQAGEAIVMKRANRLWRQRLRADGVPFWQVNFVHDEWQTLVPRDMELALHVANTQAQAIADVGVELGLRCPLLGSIRGAHGTVAIGDNWLDTH